MPVSIPWSDPEQTIATWNVTEPWTWDDVWQALDETNAVHAGHGGLDRAGTGDHRGRSCPN